MSNLGIMARILDTKTNRVFKAECPFAEDLLGHLECSYFFANDPTITFDMLMEGSYSNNSQKANISEEIEYIDYYEFISEEDDRYSVEFYASEDSEAADYQWFHDEIEGSKLCYSSVNDKISELEEFSEQDLYVFGCLYDDCPDFDSAYDRVHNSDYSYYENFSMGDIAKENVDEGFYDMNFLKDFIDYDSLGEYLYESGDFLQTENGIIETY